MVEQSTIGGFFDLTALEAGFVLANPQTTTDSIIQAVAPEVRGCFSRGSEAVLSNQELFAYFVERDPTPFLKHYTEWMSLERSFSVNTEQRIPNPREYSLLPQEEAQGAFKRIVETVAKQLAEHGDKKLQDPTGLAVAYFEKAIPYALRAYRGSTSDPIFELLEKEWGVTRDRLPDEPTIQDVGDELIFVQHLSLIECRRGLTSGSLRGRIRKEQLPSWRVWSAFNRLLSRKPRVSGSDLGDLAILPFALYAGAVQVDKRVHTDIAQVRDSSILQRLKGKLFRNFGDDYGRLLGELDRIEST